MLTPPPIKAKAFAILAPAGERGRKGHHFGALASMLSGDCDVTKDEFAAIARLDKGPRLYSLGKLRLADFS